MIEQQPDDVSDQVGDTPEVEGCGIDYLKRPTQADMVAVSERTNRRADGSIGAAAIGASLAL